MLLDVLAVVAVGYLCLLAFLSVLVVIADVFCVVRNIPIQRSNPPVWLGVIDAFLFVAALFVLFLDGKLL